MSSSLLLKSLRTTNHRSLHSTPTRHNVLPPSSSILQTNISNTPSSSSRNFSSFAPPPPSYPSQTQNLPSLPSRTTQLAHLKNSTIDNKYDVLIIGGGATGAGCAFDAATRGLKVACIERGDFASETSSRSTKLIWAGIRYLATSAAALLSVETLKNPRKGVNAFIGEFTMVVGCHTERRYMLSMNPHLTKWVPIAIPFDKWVVWPPPFGHPLFALFPILAPLVLKFYDSLSSFSCPPSYIMGPTLAKQKFPQLSHKDLKYASVFYEAMHNDSRTNISIALTAAEKGANICNYVEATSLIFDDKGEVKGAKVCDSASNEAFEIHANKVIFCGGPFTDAMREMESGTMNNDSNSVKLQTKPAVQGASGSHIVLPSYYCPPAMGLLDYNTSDGRFLFLLPWQGHTLVGTTDRKCSAISSPKAPEDEIKWLLKECEKYLSHDLRVRRSDVTSAWRGWRPLAVDPHKEDSSQSRDHVISTNPKTGVIFIAGGKWTTWREMAEHAIDRISDVKCTTKEIPLLGGEGWTNNLAIKLVQKHGILPDVAEHLANCYGVRAYDVCNLAKPTGHNNPRFGVQLVQGFPYIEAEVRYACREYAVTIEDFVSRRSRLAFLHSEAALSVIPRVADIMQEELGWTDHVRLNQIRHAVTYVQGYGGPIPDNEGASLRSATYRDVADIFKKLDEDGSGFLDVTELQHASVSLGFPISKEELNVAFEKMGGGDGRVNLEEFEKWWNNVEEKGGLQEQLKRELRTGQSVDC